MKTKNFCLNFMRLPKIIRHFGRGCLVQVADGHFELVGGSEADYAAAQEWASLFAHEVVFNRPSTLAQSPRPKLDRPPVVPTMVPGLKRLHFQN